MKKRAIFALIALVAIPILFTMLAGTFPKRYTAASKILISAPSLGRYDNGPLQALDDITNFSGARTASTQIDVITGTDVLREAIRKTQQKLPAKFPIGRSASQQFEELLRRLAVDSEKDSDVLYVRVTNEDPELAAAYANEICNSYIQFARGLSKESAGAALTVMRDQLKSTKERLNKIDQDVAALKLASDTPDVQASSAAASQDIVQSQQRYAETLGAWQGAVVELAAAKATLNTLPRTIVSSQNVENNPVVTQLQLEVVKANNDLVELRTRYQDDFPDVLAAKRRLASLEDQMRKMKPQIKGGYGTVVNPVYSQQQLTVSQLEGRAASLEKQMEAAKNRMIAASQRTSSVTEVDRKLAALQRERIVLEQTYLQVEQRREITESIGTARQSTARIVSVAIPPSQPSFPDPRIFTLAGLAIGIFTAVLILMPRASDRIVTNRVYNDFEPMPPVATPTLKPGDSPGEGTAIVPKDDVP